MRTWTPEARQAQSEAIRRWQPWNRSTGPQTPDGKARCRLNAHKHGRYNADDVARRRAMVAALKRHRVFLKNVRLALRLRKYLKIEERTIMNHALIIEGQAVCDALDHAQACKIQQNYSNIVFLPLSLQGEGRDERKLP